MTGNTLTATKGEAVARMAETLRAASPTVANDAARHPIGAQANDNKDRQQEINIV